MRLHPLNYFLRRWAPWVTLWGGWWISRPEDAHVLTTHPRFWGTMWLVVVFFSVLAGTTRSIRWFSLYVASFIAVGGYRALDAGLTHDVWTPTGIWLIILGAHFLAWTAVDRDTYGATPT